MAKLSSKKKRNMHFFFVKNPVRPARGFSIFKCSELEMGFSHDSHYPDPQSFFGGGLCRRLHPIPKQD
jgi:hypothetical protein